MMPSSFLLQYAMIRIISESQPGAYGLSIDYILDLAASDVIIAVDLRDFTGTITPQFSDAIVILTYADDLIWLFGGTEKPEYYGYVKTFKSYQEYCSWVNLNSLQ